MPERAAEPNVNLCRHVGEQPKKMGLPDVSDETILRAATGAQSVRTALRYLPVPVPFLTPFILPSDKVTGMTDVGPLHSRAGSRSGAVAVAPCQSFCARPVAAALLFGAYDTILELSAGANNARTALRYLRRAQWPFLTHLFDDGCGRST